MNSRERLRRCFFYEEMDRPAVYSRRGFPGDDPTYDGLKEYLAEYSDLKYTWSSSRIVETFPAETHTEEYSEGYERLVTVLHTPEGDLTSVRLVSRKGQPDMDETFFIESRKDAEAYLSLPVPEITGNVSSFFEEEKNIGERGIVDVSLGLNPAGTAASLAGTENFALLSVTDRDIIHELCARKRDVILQRLECLIENNVGPFFSMLGQEYVAPPIHSPKDFRDFNFKYDRPIIERVHEAGGRMHIHCHGRIKTVLDAFLEMETDVLHPFEAPPMGDITPKEAKEKIRGRICFEGNIQIADMYEQTPEEIREQTLALIHDVFDDSRGLIVCPSASPYLRGEGQTCFPQYKAMIDTVVNFRPS